MSDAANITVNIEDGANITGGSASAAEITSSVNQETTISATITSGAKGDKGDTGATGPTGATGATGPTGPAGATGAKGDTGATGAAGADGATWTSGTSAPSGGNNGDFYLKTDTYDVYKKSAGSWSVVANIKGATGATGATGSTGSTGATGAAGADGKSVLNGSGAPSAGTGVDGDFYIDTSAHSIYGPKASGAWGSGTSLVGPTGSTGSAGADGAAATIAVGTVTTGAAGSSATITNSGTSSAAVFDFTIPKGDTGAAGAGSGDMLAATYDPNNKATDAFSMDNMVQGSTKKYVSATDVTNLGNLSGTNTGDQTNITGNAATVTTNANLTGPITSSGNATAVASQTGTGSKFVMDTSPTIASPTITGAVMDATTIATDTTTGLTIGTGTTQKLGFFNHAPAVQQTATTDLGTALSNLGLRASGTAYPITTSGAVSMTGTVSAKNIAQSLTSTATAAGTTTLTNTSTQFQIFTGTSTQTVKLPTTSLAAGWDTVIINQSTGAVTVQSSAANTILVLAPGTAATFIALVATPTTAANWTYEYIGDIVASGKSLTVSNSLTLAGTDATTMTFPSSSDTVVGLTASQTLTNKTLTSPVINTSIFLPVDTEFFGSTSGHTTVSAAATASGTLTLPAATDTLVGQATTDTLTNKTLTTPVIDQFGSASGLGAAWSSWTPTITANSGTFTSVSATGKYIQIGKTVFANAKITITTNGTAAGNLLTTLPITAKDNTGTTSIGFGRANSVTGKMQQVSLKSSTSAGIWNYDGTYGGSSGEVIIIDMVYEAA